MCACMCTYCVFVMVGGGGIRPLIAIVQTRYPPPPPNIPSPCYPLAHLHPYLLLSFLLNLSPHLTPLLHCTLFHQPLPFPCRSHVTPPMYHHPLSHTYMFFSWSNTLTATTNTPMLILKVNHPAIINILYYLVVFI